VVTEQQTHDGGDVLPGFSLDLGRFFRAGLDAVTVTCPVGTSSLTDNWFREQIAQRAYDGRCYLVPSETSEMSDQPEPINFFFRLVVFASALFVITIFALVATIFSDPDVPAVQFLNEYGGTLIAGEVIATLLIGFLAMAVDRRQILRKQPADEDAAGFDTVSDAKPQGRKESD